MNFSCINDPRAHRVHRTQESEQWHLHPFSKWIVMERTAFLSSVSCLKLFFKGLGLFFKDFYLKVIWSIDSLWLRKHEQGRAITIIETVHQGKPFWNSGTEYFLDINDKVNSGIPDLTSTSLTSNPERKLYTGNNGQLIKEDRSLFLIVKEIQVNFGNY